MKRLVCFINAIICCLCAKAQYEQQWGLSFPWNESLNIVAAISYADGYALTGAFSDTLVLGNDTLCSHGMEDVFLLQLSSDGKINKAVSFGDTGNDTPISICVDDGGLYILGCSRKGEHSSVFVLPFRRDSVWGNPFVFPFEGLLHPDFIEADSNSIIIGGSLKGALSFGSQKIESKAIERSFFLTLSKDGIVLSEWLASGDCPNRMRSFSIDDEGNRILLLNTGMGSIVFSDTACLEMDKNGVLLLKLDPGRNPMWVQKIVANGFVESTSFAADSLGYAIAVNHSDIVSLEGRSFSPSGGLSSLLVHYDNNGLFQWIKEINSDEHCRIMKVGTVEGTVFCTGYYYGSLEVEGDTVHHSGERTSFLTAFDLNGGFIWGRDVENNSPTAAYELVCDTASVLLNGSVTCRESAAFTNKYIVKSEREVLAADTLNSILSHLADHKEDKDTQQEYTASCEVFPNPTRSKLYWTTTLADDWCLYLIDEKGIVIHKETVGNASAGCVDLTRFPPGLYFLKITSKDRQLSRGFTKY